LSSTVPFTWADGDRLVASLIYNTPAPPALSAYDTTALTLGSEVYAPVSRVTIVDDDEVVPTPTLWFDASDTSSITTDGSNGVTAWRPLTDTTGSGATDFVQATAASRPLSGTRTVNSLNVVDFDGSNDFLDITTPVSFTQPCIVYVVMQQDIINTTSTTDFILDGKDTATRLYVGLRGSAYRIGGTTSTQIVSGGSQTTADPVMMQVKWGGLSSTNPAVPLGNLLYVDGAYTMIEGAATNAWSAMTVGRSQDAAAGTYFDGVICEIMVYNRELTDSEQYAINDYLTTQWGI